MNILRIKETCLYVTDLERTRKFYESVIGLKTIAIADGRHIFFQAGESVLLCFIASETKNEKTLPPHGSVGSIHFAFETKKKDFEIARNRIAEQSNILHEQHWKNGTQSFYFHDPDNHLVEIIEEGLWDPY